MGGSSVDRTQDLIQIVFKGNVAFYVSKSRLCSVSRHFRELLNSDASTDGNKELHLLQENPNIWQWFQLWLNTGRLRESYDLTRTGWINFLTLYFFAKENVVPQLQNDLMDVMGDLIQRVAPDPKMINLIWSKTNARSALRGLIIEGFVYELYPCTVLRYHKYHNTEFLQALIHYYQDISAPITSRSCRPFMVPCRYHVHEPGDPPCPQAQGVFAQATAGMPESDPPCPQAQGGFAQAITGMTESNPPCPQAQGGFAQAITGMTESNPLCPQAQGGFAQAITGIPESNPPCPQAQGIFAQKIIGMPESYAPGGLS